jgi:uncharacterized membrane protein
MSNELQSPPWPGMPRTSSELVPLITHYYRAEMSRMSAWRDRIDRTTNWLLLLGQCSHCRSPRPPPISASSSSDCWIVTAAIRRQPSEGELAIGDVHV